MTTEMPTTDAIRKVAILVSALDRDSADAILDKMGAEQAARVRNAVFELETISDQEQDRIVREFVSAGGGMSGGIADHDRQRKPGGELDVRQSRLVADEDAAYERAAALGELAAHQSAGDSATTPVDERSVAAPTDSAASAGEISNDRACGAVVPFPILREASVETLATHLAHENAQVIAVVVAHLPPKRAADLLAQLPPQLQADVLRRVAALDAAAPEAMEVLQLQLETKLAEEVRAQRNRMAGLATVNSILSAAGSKRQEILENLTRNDQQLSQLVASAPIETSDLPAPKLATAPADSQDALVELAPEGFVAQRWEADDAADAGSRGEEPRVGGSRAEPPPASHQYSPEVDPAPITAGATRDLSAAFDHESPAIAAEAASDVEPIAFERLVELGDAELASLFRELDPSITLLALAGASPEFIDRVMRPLPPREARTLRRKMERLGPIRLSDIAAAQREVARTASEMMNEGRLQQLAAPRFAVAA